MRRTGPPALAAAVALAVLYPCQAAAQDAFRPRDIYRIDAPAVVTIDTPTGLGSGVIIDPTGVVVSNLHVVDDSSNAVVTLANGDSFDDVTVIDYDPRRDLVLLKVNGQGLPTVALGDSDSLVVGDEVFAIGTPKGLAQTLSAGLVSAMRDFGEGYRRIQTTTPISLGSSGGGLFDDRGRLVGITKSLRRDGQNLNFAVPINPVRAMLGTVSRMTLGELKALRSIAESARPRVPSSNVTPPTLAKAYVAANGSILLFEQTDSVLRATFSHGNGEIFARGRLEWDAAMGSFHGRGLIKHACGSSTVDVPIPIEIRTVSDSTIRNRWETPDKVNCRTGKIRSSTREMVWALPTQ
jgi:hypothetical protein